jgi:hypothetical protein
MMTATKFFAVACLALLPALAPGATIVNVPTLTLLPNTPNQAIQINISGGDSISGAQLAVQLTGPGTLPLVTGGSILNGTIFAGNNSGEANNFFQDSSAFLDTSTATPGTFVTGQGLLATILVSTTGITAGTYTLNFLNTNFGNSVISTSPTNSPVTFVPGTIVVPEPASLAVLSGAGLMLLRRKRA